MHRAVFLDRDGTLIADQQYNFQPSRIRLLGGVPSGLRALQQAGYKLVVITNQSGVARGMFEEGVVQEMHTHLASLLAEQGVAMDAFYYCPHHAEGQVAAYAVECECRKPRPGMITTAARDLCLDLTHSWVVGDICDDVRAGHRAGCRTVLIDPDGTERLKANDVSPTYTVAGFLQAATIILGHGQGEADGQGS